MTKNQNINKALLLFTSAFLLVGCGGPSSQEGSSESSSEEASSSLTSSISESTSSSPADNKKVTFSFWHTFGQKAQDALILKARQFEQLCKTNLGVDVTVSLEYQGDYDAIKQKIEKSFSGNDTPTIAVAYPDHVADYLAAEGSNAGKYVENIEHFFTDTEIGFETQSWLGDEAGCDEDDIVEAFAAEGRSYVRDGVYSLPYMKSSEVMFYNVEAAYRALAIYRPDLAEGQYKEYLNTMTWTDFMGLCASAKANKATVDPLMDVPFVYDSDGNMFISKMYQNEIGYASIKDGHGTIDFIEGENRSKAESMMTRLAQNYSDGLLTTKGITGRYGSDFFKDMTSIFTVGSSGGTGYNSPSSDVFTVGVCPVPAENNNPLYVTQGPTLTFLRNQGKSQEENDLRLKYGWMFAKFITNPEHNVYLTTAGSEGYIPVRYSAYESATFLEYMEEGEIYQETASILINKFSNSYLVSPTFKGSADLRTNCGGIFKMVAKGEKSVNEAFTAAINEAIKGM